MTSQVPRVVVNTRQRLLSEDFNNISRLTSRAQIMLELAREVGDDYLLGGLGRSGVVGGFMVRCIPATNLIEVTPGIALLASAPVSTTYDPPAIWIQSDSTVQLDLSGIIDPANPRLVTLEVGPSDVVIVATPVDVFDPGTGLFGINPTAPRVQGSAPVWITTAGAPAASPVIAGGTVGRIPLAVIKLTAAQASFADEFASVLMCRPLLGADADRLVPRGYVDGGGCSVGEESGGVLVGLTDIYLSRLTASLAGLEAEVSGLIPFPTRARTSSLTSPAALLAVASPVYGYAAPPPWPGDYGPMAPREAWQRNPNAVPFAAPGNVIGGAGTTFRSLAAETTSSPGRSLRNAIVLWDDVGPYGLERGAGNAPLQVIDARGPHPDTAPGGAGSITLATAQDPTWGPSQTVTESVYLGAVSALGLANDFMAQTYTGHGRVRLTDLVQIAGATKRRPYREIIAGVGAITAFYPGRFPGMLVGNTQVLPITAQQLELWARFVSGTGGNVFAQIFSGFGFGSLEGGLSSTGGWAAGTIDTTATNSITFIEPAIELEVNANGECFFAVLVSVATSLLMTPNAYFDIILAER